MPGRRDACRRCVAGLVCLDVVLSLFSDWGLVLHADAAWETEYALTDTDDHQFSLTIQWPGSADLNGKTVEVLYDGELNENAVLGQNGNVNKAKLYYTNNTYAEFGPASGTSDGGDDTGSTGWDSVICFTYQVEVNKVDEDGAALEGAEFKLEKLYQNGTKAEIATVKNSKGTTFTFTGLDDGQYLLTETETPEGYNPIQPIAFTVSAEHKVQWEWNGEAQSSTMELTSLSGNKVSGTADFTLQADENLAVLRGSVENTLYRAALPKTGGMGIGLFYTLGTALVFGSAAVLAIQSRRKRRVTIQ